MDCWNKLDIKPTDDKRAIRKAYAVLLKVTSPEDDAQAYQSLREAYQSALSEAEYIKQDDEDTISDTASKVQYSYSFSGSGYSESSYRTIENKESDADAYSFSQNDLTEEPLDPQAAAIERLFLQLQYSDQQITIKEFTNIVEAPDNQSLDKQYTVEGEMLFGFQGCEIIPHEFLLAVGDHYNWINDNNPFQYDDQYEHVYRTVNYRYRYVKSRVGLVRRFREITDEQWSQFDPVLLGYFQPCDLDEIYDSELYYPFDQIMFYINKINNEINVYQYPQALIDWWFAKPAKVLPDKFSNGEKTYLQHDSYRYDPVIINSEDQIYVETNTNSDSKQSSNPNAAERCYTEPKKSKTPRWVIFIVIFLVIKTIVFMANQNNPSYNYPDYSGDKYLDILKDRNDFLNKAGINNSKKPIIDPSKFDNYKY